MDIVNLCSGVYAIEWIPRGDHCGGRLDQRDEFHLPKVTHRFPLHKSPGDSRGVYRGFQCRVVAFLLVTMVWEEVGQLRLPDSMVDMMLAAQVKTLFCAFDGCSNCN